MSLTQTDGTVAADMLIFDPPYLSLFFSYTNLLSGYSLRESMSLCAKELPHTYLVDVALWTPIQLINFRFVPVLYQPLLVNGVNTGWNAYLSFVQNKDGGSTRAKVVT